MIARAKRCATWLDFTTGPNRSTLGRPPTLRTAIHPPNCHSPAWHAGLPTGSVVGSPSSQYLVRRILLPLITSLRAHCNDTLIRDLSSFPVDLYQPNFLPYNKPSEASTALAMLAPGRSNSRRVIWECLRYYPLILLLHLHARYASRMQCPQ